MPAVERLVSVVQRWVQKAEIDLKTAILVLQAGEEGPAEAAAFHAQ
jgi:HEPN domain-containing protein